MRELIKKYKELILYLIFGGLTTLVNIVVYQLFFTLLGVANVPSDIIAWVLSVLFAYVTNRRYVFASEKKGVKSVALEMGSFFGCRALTGLLDVAIMYVAVDLMAWNSLLWKIIANVIVIILNYVASKLMIFKKK